MMKVQVSVSIKCCRLQLSVPFPYKRWRKMETTYAKFRARFVFVSLKNSLGGTIK
jgi:hypothetical protein